MNTGRLRLGMLSILMTVIVICMSVLSLLSYATSLADLRLARRYAETVRIRYELEEEDERPRIAVIGKPNTGKSSLINSLVNRKSLARTIKRE